MRRGIAVLLAALLVTSACAAPARRAFALTIPGREQVQPLSVIVFDRTGGMVSIELPPIDVMPGRAGQIFALERDPAVLIVTWIGTMCDQGTELTFEQTGRGYRLMERTQRAEPCRLGAVGRTVALRLAAPVSPDLVEFVPDRS